MYKPMSPVIKKVIYNSSVNRRHFIFKIPGFAKVDVVNLLRFFFVVVQFDQKAKVRSGNSNNTIRFQHSETFVKHKLRLQKPDMLNHMFSKYKLKNFVVKRE